MKFFKKVYEYILYSEYGSIVGIVTSLTLFVLLTFLAETRFSWLLQYLGLTNIPYVLEFSGIVITILIVNVCQRAIKTSNRLRMIVYSMFFAIGAGINFIAFTNNNWFSGDIPSEVLVFFSTLSRLIIAVGLFVGSIIPIGTKIKTFKRTSLRYVIYLIWIVLVFVTLHVNSIFYKLHIETLNIMFYTMIEYATAIVLIISLAIHFRSYTVEKNRYLFTFMNGITILIVAQVVRLSFINFTYLYSFIYGLYSFIGYWLIYNAIFGYNIVSPISKLMNDEKQIKLYAENLEVIVERRTTEMQNNNIRLIQEIEYAKNIQQSLLPPRKLNFKKVVFVSEYFPCERLSGDFFDIYRLDDNNIGMYVLDVSGHGVSAALMTMFCNNYIRSSEKLIMKYRGLKPHRNLKHFYEEFNKMKFPDEMYMVMFFASYNVETGVLTYSSGGMNCYPIVMKEDGSKEYLDKSKGFPICKMSSFFTPTFTSETITLTKGDRVIFYTDGLTDNVKNSTISQEQLENIMYRYRSLSLKSLNNKLKSYINHEDGEHEDDITYFIMEI